MTLQSAHFPGQVVTDMLLMDFRSENPFLNLLMDSAASQMVLARVRAAGTAGGFASSVTIPLLPQSALSPTDGYSTVTSFPSAVENPDFSSAYDAITDESIVFNTNRVAVGTHSLPDMQRWTHSAGSLLEDAKIQADIKEIRDQVENSVLLELQSLGVPASVSAGVASRFPLVTTGESDLLNDLADLEGEFERQKVPGSERVLVLPAQERGLAVRYNGLASRDYPGIGDREAGTFERIANFNVVYSNQLSTDSAVALHLSAYAVVMPNGIVVEPGIRDITRIANFNRLYTMFGHGALTQNVAAADGSAWSAARAGIVAVSVT